MKRYSDNTRSVKQEPVSAAAAIECWSIMEQGSEPFLVYAQPSKGHSIFSFEGRDESRGVLGTIAPAEPPIITAHDLESAEERARARLGVEPDDFLYVTDDHHRVLRILINQKHHDSVEHALQRTVFGYALLVLCFSCLIAAASSTLGAWPLLVFVAIGGLYSLVVRTGVVNEVEGAVVCVIILIMVFVLLDQHSRMAAP